MNWYYISSFLKNAAWFSGFVNFSSLSYVLNCKGLSWLDFYELHSRRMIKSRKSIDKVRVLSWKSIFKWRYKRKAQITGGSYLFIYCDRWMEDVTRNLLLIVAHRASSWQLEVFAQCILSILYFNFQVCMHWNAPLLEASALIINLLLVRLRSVIVQGSVLQVKGPRVRRNSTQ